MVHRPDRPVADSRQCPLLRSALFATTSNSATVAKSSSRVSRSVKKCSSGSNSTNSCIDPGPCGPSRNTVVGTRATRARETARTPPPRAGRGCPPGSPTAEARPGAACRREHRAAWLSVLCQERVVGRVRGAGREDLERRRPRSRTDGGRPRRTPATRRGRSSPDRCALRDRWGCRRTDRWAAPPRRRLAPRRASASIWSRVAQNRTMPGSTPELGDPSPPAGADRRPPRAPRPPPRRDSGGALPPPAPAGRGPPRSRSPAGRPATRAPVGCSRPRRRLRLGPSRSAPDARQELDHGGRQLLHLAPSRPAASRVVRPSCPARRTSARRARQRPRS